MRFTRKPLNILQNLQLRRCVGPAVGSPAISCKSRPDPVFMEQPSTSFKYGVYRSLVCDYRPILPPSTTNPQGIPEDDRLGTHLFEITRKSLGIYAYVT